MRNYVSPSEIVRDLHALGITQGDLLMLHASVKSIGWVVGGPDTVLKAILETLGPSGTLVMMIGWEDYPYCLSNAPTDKQDIYFRECPAFDPALSRANHREQGILCEYLRTLPNAYRSHHPTHSVASVGFLAKEITKGHPLNYGCGKESPFEKLVQQKGKILNIGAPLCTLTILHYAEHLAVLRDKTVVRYQMPLLVEGRRTWVEIEEYDTSKGIAPWKGDYFEEIAKAYLSLGRAAEGFVGNAPSYLFDAEDLVAFGKDWMERHLTQEKTPL